MERLKLYSSSTAPSSTAAFNGGNKLFQIAGLNAQSEHCENRPRNVPRGHPEAKAALSQPALLRRHGGGGAAVE
jgi:hypothetical protein